MRSHLWFITGVVVFIVLWFFLSTGCVADVVPESDACRAWVDAIYRKADECHMPINGPLKTACDGRLVTNTQELWDTCIPQVEAAQCKDLNIKPWCNPQGVKLP